MPGYAHTKFWGAILVRWGRKGCSICSISTCQEAGVGRSQRFEEPHQEEAAGARGARCALLATAPHPHPALVSTSSSWKTFGLPALPGQCFLWLALQPLYDNELLAPGHITVDGNPLEIFFCISHSLLQLRICMSAIGSSHGSSHLVILQPFKRQSTAIPVMGICRRGT